MPEVLFHAQGQYSKWRGSIIQFLPSSCSSSWTTDQRRNCTCRKRLLSPAPAVEGGFRSTTNLPEMDYGGWVIVMSSFDIKARIRLA